MYRHVGFKRVLELLKFIDSLLVFSSRFHVIFSLFLMIFNVSSFDTDILSIYYINLSFICEVMYCQKMKNVDGIMSFCVKRSFEQICILIEVHYTVMS